MEGGYGFLAGFIGTGVEFVEALTVVLAIGLVRGWKPALLGSAGAIVVLALIAAIIGAPLAHVMSLAWVQGIVGLVTLLFGIRWLRKAILRYAGLKALHNEEEAYREELAHYQATPRGGRGLDKAAFMGAFGITFLEGLEAIFIVLTFGSSLHAMGAAIWGAVCAAVIIILLGVLVRKPLAKVPENTMKFVIGIMLTSFGAFWTGEGMGVHWPQEDASILYMAATLVLVAYLTVVYCKKQLSASRHRKEEGSGI